MAKSHLYAATLRNFGIPAAFCYQILGAKQKNHFYPHGFNADYFKSLEKWVRLDARGNKPGLARTQSFLYNDPQFLEVVNHNDVLASIILGQLVRKYGND